MPSRPPISANAEGALWMLASVAGATVMTLAVRLLSGEEGGDLHPAMTAFLRSVLALPLLLPAFWRAGHGGPPLRFTAWKLHLVRGVLLAGALNAGFYSIAHMPLATATILFFTAPIFATIGAAALMGEAVGPRRWGAVAAGFLGALLILRPGLGAFDPVMLLALGSSVCFAAGLLIGKRAGEADGTTAVFVSSSLVVAVATLPGAVLVWKLPVDWAAWGLLALLVAGSVGRTYSDIRAYAAGEAGFLAPFSYLRLITIGAIGYFVFAERIDGFTWAGGAVIISATLYIAFRERRKSVPRRGPKAGPEAA